MKKKKFESKLLLNKNNVSNLANIKGGNMPPFDCTMDFSGCVDYTDGCGTGNCGGGGGGQTVYNCLTNNHPISDPIHCRTCHDAC